MRRRRLYEDFDEYEFEQYQEMCYRFAKDWYENVYDLMLEIPNLGFVTGIVSTDNSPESNNIRTICQVIQNSFTVNRNQLLDTLFTMAQKENKYLDEDTVFALFKDLKDIAIQTLYKAIKLNKQMYELRETYMDDVEAICDRAKYE